LRLKPEKGWKRQFAKGVMTMELGRRRVWLIIFVLMTVLLTGCNGGSYAIRSGSINVYNDSMDGEYKSFSGYFYKTLELEKGEIVRFCLDESTSCGKLYFGLEDSDGNILIDIEDDLIWEVPKVGSYRIFAEGEDHGGRFCLNWVAEPDGNPADVVKIDNVEAFIYRMLYKSMTQAEEIEVIHQLQFVDWRSLQGMGGEPAMDLFEWLHGLEDEKKLSRLSYLHSIKGIDGAYAESYEVLMGELFLDDPERFVVSLKCMDDETIERVTMFVLNYLKYQEDDSYLNILENMENEDPIVNGILEDFLRK
jgi:hypothetical protein